MAFQNNEAQQTATDQFPGSGNDLGIWTTKALQNIPIVTQHGHVTTPGSLADARRITEGEGEQTEPMLTTLARYGELSTSEQAGLASLLTASGIVSSKNPTDDDIYKGYRQVVEQAARHHQTVAEVLDSLAAQVKQTGGAGGGAGGGSRAPLQITLTNPQDIAFVGNKVGQTVLGRNLNKNEIASLTKAFQAQESAAQRGAYNANISGGASTAAPDLQSFTQTELQAEHPVEATATSVANVFDTLLGLIKGG